MSGRGQPRQAEKFAQRDAGIVAQREDAYAQQYQQAPPPAYERPPSQPQVGDVVQQLKDLADLKNQGILTEDELAVQKARILSA